MTATNPRSSNQIIMCEGNQIMQIIGIILFLSASLFLFLIVCIDSFREFVVKFFSPTNSLRSRVVTTAICSFFFVLATGLFSILCYLDHVNASARLRQFRNSHPSLFLKDGNPSCVQNETVLELDTIKDGIVKDGVGYGRIQNVSFSINPVDLPMPSYEIAGSLLQTWPSTINIMGSNMKFVTPSLRIMFPNTWVGKEADITLEYDFVYPSPTWVEGRAAYTEKIHYGKTNFHVRVCSADESSQLNEYWKIAPEIKIGDFNLIFFFSMFGGIV